MDTHHHPTVCTFLALAIGGCVLLAAAPPEVAISNGLVRATIALPDAENGFYRGTRFDWAGVITSLESQGHTYFGRWFKAHDPALRDVEFRPDLDGFAAGSSSAATGPAEEFSDPIGFAEAPVGGTFVKIGVGVLRKSDDARYSFTTRYPIVDTGTRTYRSGRDVVEFEQAVGGPASTIGYRYRKVVRLTQGKAELVLEHSLQNTGRQTIDTPVYAHNFFVIDGQPSGPDFAIAVPFEIEQAADKLGILKAGGHGVSFIREPEKDERAMVSVAGFGTDPKDFDIRVEHRGTGAGVRITCDRPIAHMAVWAIRPTRCPEAFIDVRVEPGREFTWRLAYEFYTVPKR